jgi:hypothetical protein
MTQRHNEDVWRNAWKKLVMDVWDNPAQKAALIRDPAALKAKLATYGFIVPDHVTLKLADTDPDHPLELTLNLPPNPNPQGHRSSGAEVILDPETAFLTTC